MTVLFERSKAVVKFCPLRGCEGKLIVFQAVPQLRDERKALGWGQTHKLVAGEQFHASSIGKNASGSNSVMKPSCRTVATMRQESGYRVHLGQDGLRCG